MQSDAIPNSHLNLQVGGEVLGNQDTDLNTKTMDTPISDAQFLLRAIATISALPTTAAQLAAIHGLLHRTDPGTMTSTSFQ